jgi:hypothetical protein
MTMPDMSPAERRVAAELELGVAPPPVTLAFAMVSPQPRSVVKVGGDNVTGVDPPQVVTGVHTRSAVIVGTAVSNLEPCGRSA